MAGKSNDDRVIKGTSFSNHDDYEIGLLAFATDPARGKKGQFGPYVKQLIAEARERDERGEWRYQMPARPPISAPDVNEEDSEAALMYL